MSNCFTPLPSDCIEYYDLSEERLVALSHLAAGELDRDLYLGLNLAFSIGKLHSETAQNLPLTPIGGGQYFLAAKLLDDYGQADAKAVDRVIEGLTEKIQHQTGITQTHIDALFDVHRSLLNFDRQIIGGDRVRIGTNTDNRIISPTLMKAPIWHFDMESDQAMPADENALLPERLSPVVRGYGIRVVPSDVTENVQPEYIRDAQLLSKDGHPNPLILASREIAKRAQDFRLSFGIGTPEIGKYFHENATFADGWTELLNEQQVVVLKMRYEGLVQQAAPDEVLIASNYSYHCARQPSRKLPSLFFGLQVRSLG